MNSNINMVDRYVRLASGLVMLGVAMGMKRRSPIARTALLGFGAMKVAEGATGWCPLVHLAGQVGGQETSNQSQKPEQSQSAEGNKGTAQNSRNRHSSDRSQDSQQYSMRSSDQDSDTRERNTRDRDSRSNQEKTYLHRDQSSNRRDTHRESDGDDRSTSYMQ